MTTYYDDTDLTGSGEFAEPTVTLSTEFTVGDGTANSIRARFPALAGATVLGRIYNASNTLLFSASSFDTTTADAWNSATISGGLALSAGTYRVCQVVTRYIAKGGFFSGGAITRGSITGNRGMFDSGDVAPTQASTATYFVDWDFTAGGGGSAITVIDLASGPRFRSATETTVFGAALVDPPGGARWRSGVEAAVLGVAASDSAGRALVRSADGAGVVSGFAAGDLPGGLRVRSAAETILTGVAVGDTPGRVSARSATESVAIGTLLPVTFADAIAGMRARSGRETILTPVPAPISDVTPIIVPVRRVRAEPRVRRGTYIVKVEEVTNATD